MTEVRAGWRGFARGNARDHPLRGVTWQGQALGLALRAAVLHRVGGSRPPIQRGRDEECLRWCEVRRGVPSEGVVDCDMRSDNSMQADYLRVDILLKIETGGRG